MAVIESLAKPAGPSRLSDDTTPPEPVPERQETAAKRPREIANDDADERVSQRLAVAGPCEDAVAGPRASEDPQQGAAAAPQRNTPPQEAESAAPPPAQPPQPQARRKLARAWSALRRSAHPAITESRSIYSYERLNHIQEGTYGVVFRARPRDSEPQATLAETASTNTAAASTSTPSSSRTVAVKKLKLDKNGLMEGFPITSLREIQALTLARTHSNVIRLHEVCIGKTLDQIFLVMEFMEHDLKTLLTSFHRAKTCFAPSEVKTLMHQLLTATKQLHEEWILHRDLKSSNLLMDNRGSLKVADFGLARRYGDPIAGWSPASEPRGSSRASNGEAGVDGGMTDMVVTLWYRAPELLHLNKMYKEKDEQANRRERQSGRSSSTAPPPPLYDEKIDMWSIGCIFAELLLTSKTGGGLFQGKNEADQFRRIANVLGPPNSIIWPDLPLYSSRTPARQSAPRPSEAELDREEHRTKRQLAEEFRPMQLTTATLDLLFRLLHYDPKQRIGAKEALQHDYFTTEAPNMAHPDSFGSFPSVAAGESVPYDTPSAPIEYQRRNNASSSLNANPAAAAASSSRKEYPLEFDFNV